ncbi:MAG: type II 3-dehydroquinate dehydratase [Gammaproteobacteria bacterium]|nr:type II 3-dehydroquinate dehydratase [Gammaproteobacteria bacterium]
MKDVHILNGPNINMTGLRDATQYGSTRYDDICGQLVDHGKSLGLAVTIRQSNYEGELVTWCHEIAVAEAPLVINAGAYTHTSVALLDALSIIKAPKVEVHMSNVHAREEFRHHSYLALAVDGSIVGFGVDSYRLALQWVSERT